MKLAQILQVTVKVVMFGNGKSANIVIMINHKHRIARVVVEIEFIGENLRRKS